MFRPAVQPAPSRSTIGVGYKSVFGGDHHLVANRGQRFADEFFVGERAVHFRRIEKRHAAFHGGPNQRDHLLLIRRRTQPKAHSHAAQAHRRNFQTALSKFALLHWFSSETVSHFSRGVWIITTYNNARTAKIPASRTRHRSLWV